MALNLVDLLTAYNGASFLQAGTVEWGYVEPQWYLALPDGNTMSDQTVHVVGTSPFGVTISAESFIKANYARLISPNALGNADKALFITLLRYHFARSGLLDVNLDRRGVIDNEYSLYTHLGDNWDAAANNVPTNANAANIANFVKKFGDTILQILVYVFSARGHHWQIEYDQLYDRLLAANSIIKPAGWTFPTNQELFRNGLHCLGIRIPLEFVAFCKNNSRMSNPMAIRFYPHAPIAGAAQVLTTKAVLNAMSAELWWGEFAQKFANEIQNINHQVAAITLDPYRYHVSSRVMTGQVKIELTAEFETAFDTIAQYCLGYLDYLGRRSALSGQEAIKHHCGGIKATAETFSKACDKLGKPNIEGITMAQFIQSL